MTITIILTAAGLLAGSLSLILIWVQRSALSRNTLSLREELDKGRRECLENVAAVAGSLETLERGAQSSMELLRDGRLGLPARARALRMLRSGMGADTAAAELGLAKSEVRLLEKVGSLLSPR